MRIRFVTATLFACLTIVAAPTLGQTAPQTAATPLPVDIYLQAVRTMRSIQAPAYVEFDGHEDITPRHAGDVTHYDVVERTSDRVAYFRNLDAAPGVTRRIVEVVPPDLFLGHSVVVASANAAGLSVDMGDKPDAPLKTIAVVTASQVSYTVTNLGVVDLPACPEAIHLQLEPLSKPLVHNLRELWVNPVSSRICKAIAIWNAAVGFGRQNVPVTLDLGTDGFVQAWNTAATAHYMFGSYGIRQQVTFDDIHAVDPGVWSALDR